MAITQSTQGTTLGARTPINVVRLAAWKITETESGESYGNVIDFDKRFILPRQEDSDLYRSGMNCRQPVGLRIT